MGEGKAGKEGRPMTIKGERPDSVSPATTGNTFCTLAHRPGFLEFVCTPFVTHLPRFLLLFRLLLLLLLLPLRRRRRGCFLFGTKEENL